MKSFSVKEYEAGKRAVPKSEWIKARKERDKGNLGPMKALLEKMTAASLAYRESRKTRRALKLAALALIVGLILLYGYRP